MKRLFGTFAFLLALTLVSLGQSRVQADEKESKPFIHPLFSDEMVLQREIAAPIGMTPGKTVTVSMHGKSAKSVADASGKWMAKIGRFPQAVPTRSK